MTPREHYLAAERTLNALAKPEMAEFIAELDVNESSLTVMANLARAQVHATLATVREES